MNNWSNPVNLSNSEMLSGSPSMAVDPSGGVHVVWSEETEDGRSFISYTHLIDGNWSTANEITGSPYSQVADYPTLAADANGYLHLVWRGDATLYYSRAYAPLAEQAQGWSPPTALEYVQDNIGRPHLQIDSENVLHLVYPITLGANSGIFYMKSDDGGENWSDPTRIYKNSRADRVVDMTRLAVGTSGDGRLHVVWVESDYPETFPPIGIRYSNSSDSGETWSEATSLADGPYSFPGVITRGAGEVHVVYSGTGGDRFKFHRWSADGGTTWEEVFRNTEVGGYQGLPALFVDGNQTLHWLTSATVFSIRADALYHAEWRDGIWQPGEVVMQAEAVGQNQGDVAAAISFGDELHVVNEFPLFSETQPQGYQQEIYTITEKLNTPENLTVSVLTAPTAVPTITPPVSLPAPTVSVNQPILTEKEKQAPSNQFGLSSVIGLSTLIVLGLVMVVFLVARRSQHL